MVILNLPFKSPCRREVAMEELQARKDEATRADMPPEWDPDTEGMEDDKDTVKLPVGSRITEADEQNDRK